MLKRSLDSCKRITACCETFVVGMRKDCEVLIHVDIEKALAGQIRVSA